MCRVDAHDQGAIAECGKLDAGSGGQAGLADASLAGEHEDPHNSIVSVGSAVFCFRSKEVKRRTEATS